VSAHRIFDGRPFDLNEIKAIKNSQPGTTVNDVVVSVCGGALRKYLEAKNELPEESLVAMAPMSVRPDEKRGSAGNLVTAMSLPIRSDLADPLERLLAVSEESTQAKKLAYTMGPNLAADAAEFLPSTISGLIARTYANSGLADRISPLVNTVITNIPGVNVPLYSMGSRMVATFGLGPVTHGLGLFQPVVSSNNVITISAIADRDMMPDPSFYCRCLESAYQELKAATIERPAAHKAAESKPKRKPGGRKTARSKNNGSTAAEVTRQAG
jgi:diacylglycerol O-acyltransferase / wax synthase